MEELQELISRFEIVANQLEKITGNPKKEEGWENVFDCRNIRIDLTEEEKLADFFLGLFPDIDSADDLADELSAYFEDLQANAKARLSRIKDKDAEAEIVATSKVEAVSLFRKRKLNDRDLVKAVVDFCEYFADNAQTLAKDLLKLKRVLISKVEEKVGEAVKKEIDRSKKEISTSPLSMLEREQFNTYRRFANERGAFFAAHTFTDQYESNRNDIQRRCDEVEQLAEELNEESG